MTTNNDNNNNNKPIWNFIFEVGLLKKIKHEGWRFAGVDHPESVADHSLRAAQIGFILAAMEKYENPLEVCAILVFHDNGECRIGDLHKVANGYVTSDEERAVRDQVADLGDTGKTILELWKQIEHKHTRAGIIAKDADMLEQAATAKEYVENGHPSAQAWIDRVSKMLRTESAKKLIGSLNTVKSSGWWAGLKKFH